VPFSARALLFIFTFMKECCVRKNPGICRGLFRDVAAAAIRACDLRSIPVVAFVPKITRLFAIDPTDAVSECPRLFGAAQPSTRPEGVRGGVSKRLPPGLRAIAIPRQ